MLLAIVTFAVLAAALGLLLGAAAVYFRVPGDPVAERIDALLPQTQCGQCDFPGCRPYAAAIANGAAPINRCAPGGDATMRAIAELLDIEPLALAAGHDTSEQTLVALIDEAACIGCAKCLHACPVDAIIGAAKYLHTVIAAECTGCELCLPPCPVDCIDLVAATPQSMQRRHAAQPVAVITPRQHRA